MPVEAYSTPRTSFALWDVLDLLMYSSVYLSIAAGAMVYVSSMFQGMPFSFTLFGIGFIITFSVYNMNRKTDEQEDSINHLQRYAFTKKYEKPLFWTSLLGYLLACVLAGFHGLLTAAVAAIPLMSGILYSVPVLPKSLPYRRLKEIPLVKNLTVAIAWSAPPTLLPVYAFGAEPTLVTLVVGMFFFSLVFINTTLFDMRDIDGDAASGVRTVAVLLGLQRTRLLLTLLNALFGIVILWISLAVMPIMHTILLVIAMLYAQVYIFSFERINLTKVVCDLMADGQFIWFGSLVCLANLLVVG
ncbi:MAG: UbiA family prenyltransferase [Methanomicrobiales archaeon]|nr:UbiA family prenyltransferase [Methanomicrobiales archaeon]MDI6876820.1 UbiA family prenyltransferase [Methanomicrobiales archaeon]